MLCNISSQQTCLHCRPLPKDLRRWSVNLSSVHHVVQELDHRSMEEELLSLAISLVNLPTETSA